MRVSLQQPQQEGTGYRRKSLALTFVQGEGASHRVQVGTGRQEKLFSFHTRLCSACHWYRARCNGHVRDEGGDVNCDGI